MAANAGAIDVYQGGAGVDTLTLELNGSVLQFRLTLQTIYNLSQIILTRYQVRLAKAPPSRLFMKLRMPTVIPIRLLSQLRLKPQMNGTCSACKNSWSARTC
jgi:hypothetical protein